MKDFFIKIKDWYLEAGLDETVDDKPARRVKFLKIFAILGVSSLTIFGYVNLKDGNTAAAISELTLSLLLVTTVILLNVVKNKNKCN